MVGGESKFLEITDLLAFPPLGEKGAKGSAQD